MSYGHAHHLTGPAPGPVETTPAGSAPAESTPPVDPALYWRDDLRTALARHDFAAVYRALKDEAGLSQRRIAGADRAEPVRGLRDPGRPPRDHLCRAGAHRHMLRRHLLALGGITLTGAAVPKLGELLAQRSTLPLVPLPERLTHAHVATIRELAQLLDRGQAALTFGPDLSVSSAAAEEATRLLGVSGPEPVKQALMVAVAELHIQAGWAGFEANCYDRTLYHYTHALELATRARDAYCQVLALNWAGLACVEHDHPGDGLKLLQIAQVKAREIPRTERRPVVIGEGSRAALMACGRADSATALAALGEPEAGYRELGTSRELWQPTSTDRSGDLDRPAALLELSRGRLDTAQQLALASVRRWESSSQVGRTNSSIVLATIHIRAGDSGGLRLAHETITATGKLTSVRARRRLEPLAEALETRRGADYTDLARTARLVATTRA